MPSPVLSIPSADARTPRRRRRAARLAVAAGLTLGAVAATVGPAHAELVAMPAPTATVLTPPNPCQTFLRCPVSTTATLNQVDLVIDVTSEFPHSATGSVTLTLHCNSGVTRSTTEPIGRVVTWKAAGSNDPLPYATTRCTVTQTVPSGFTTTTSVSVPRRPADDGFTDEVGFFNT